MKLSKIGFKTKDNFIKLISQELENNIKSYNLILSENDIEKGLEIELDDIVQCLKTQPLRLNTLDKEL